MYNQLKEHGMVSYETSNWEAPFYFEANERRVDRFDTPSHVDEHESIGIEHKAVRETAGLCDLTSLAPIEIAGSSAPDFVQELCSNDMSRDVGQARYTLILDEEGGILADVVVTRLADERYFVVAFGGATASEVTQWIANRAPADVSVTNLDDAYACIGVWGPAAREVVQPLTEADLSTDSFPYFTSQQFEISGIPVTAQRVSYVGELGWELWTTMGYVSELWDELWKSGKEQDAVPMGFGALDTMGVEKGNRFLGFDIGPEYDPFEAGLERWVDMDTEFVGKAALEQAEADGIDRKIACITMDDRTVHPDIGQPVLTDDEVVAETVRTAYGYSVDESIAYAYVPIEFTEPGSNVEIEIDGSRHSGTVQEEPLFDPEYERVRSSG